MKKVLAFFGAFNPPTNAHILAAKHAMEVTGREGVIFVPSKYCYITDVQKKDYAFGDDGRCTMLRHIASENPWMIVNQYDMSSPEQPRTYASLCHLREIGYDPTLLVGTDVLFRMQTEWAYVENIANEFGIVVINRYGFNKDAIKEHPLFAKFRDRIEVVELPKDSGLEDISSTSVRAYLKQYFRLKKKLLHDVPRAAFSSLLFEAEGIFTNEA